MKYFKLILDILFYIFYIALFVISLLDIFGLISFWNDSLFIEKIIILTFSCVGFVVLTDKRESEKALRSFEKVFSEFPGLLQKIEENTKKSDYIEYLPSKREFYLRINQIFLTIPNDSEILITNYEKNFEARYDEGEVEQIKSFMKTWDDRIRANQLIVKHHLHITSKRDMDEAWDRIDKFKDINGYLINATIALPIKPFLDFCIINEEHIFIGFSKDIGSPCNIEFGIYIHSTQIGRDLAHYFNIYWSFSQTLKAKDYINTTFFNQRKYLLEKNIFDYTKDYGEELLQLINLDERIDIISPLKTMADICLDEQYNYFVTECKKCLEALSISLQKIFEESYFITDILYVNDFLRKLLMNSKKEVIIILEYASAFEKAIESIWTQKDNCLAVCKVIYICPEEKVKEVEAVVKKRRKEGWEAKCLSLNSAKSFLICDDLLFVTSTEKPEEIEVSLNKKIIASGKEEFLRIQNMI